VNDKGGSEIITCKSLCIQSEKSVLIEAQLATLKVDQTSKSKYKTKNTNLNEHGKVKLVSI